MPKKNLIYERYNFLSARQKSAKYIDAYVTRLRLLTKSCDYGGFEEEMILGSTLWLAVFRLVCDGAYCGKKGISLEFLQKIARTMNLSDHQT